MAKYKTLIIALSTIGVAVIVYFIVKLVITPEAPDEQEKVTCGAKVVYRYRFPSRAFPVVANSYDAEIKFTSDILKRITDSAGSLDIGVNVKNTLVELQEKLDQDNISFSTGLRNYFFSVNSDPCNDTLRMRYVLFTEEMSRRMIEFRNVTEEIATVTETATDATGVVPSADTATTVPPYKLVRDTTRLKQSILKLNEVVEKNRAINNKIVTRKLRP
ncbi:MAG: hypothetical protein KIT80_09720 [Chitinophagaceae bacterium]|nr:hypothetical protein [Chitinophagaceae bacterium]MCW5927177.1 hypothetical protein [Chitinophagaceae bacterium]